MKKGLSILAAVMLMTTVSCGDKKSTKSTEMQSFSTSPLSDVFSYKKQTLELPIDISALYSYLPYDNGSKVLVLGAADSATQFWHTDPELTAFEEIEYSEFDIGRSYVLDVTNDGTIVSFVLHADYGDLEPITINHMPEDYDEQLYDEAAEYTFRICTYSPDGALISASDCADFGVTPEKNTILRNVFTDGELVLADISGGWEMFRTDGSYLGEFTTDEGDIKCIGHDIDGSLLCALSCEDGDSDKLRLCRIDSDGKLTDRDDAVYDFDGTVQRIMPGSGDCDVILWSRSTAYGIRKGSPEIIPLLDLNKTGVGSDFVKAVLPYDDGTVLLAMDYSKYQLVYRKYIPVSEEELEGIDVVTLGICGTADRRQNFTDLIDEWNDGDHDFRLELKLYEFTYTEDGMSPISGLTEDLLSGDLADILYLDSEGQFGNVNLAEKNALYDIYELIDSDPELSRDDFVPNVLECFETNGKLFCITDRFTIDLGLVGKQKYLGDAEDWSLDKRIDMIIDPPNNSEPDELDSKQRRMGNANCIWWIDHKNATCFYTDDSYIRFLKWCGEATADVTVYPERSEMQEEDMRLEHMKYKRRFLDDTVLWEDQRIYSYQNLAEITRGLYGGEELTFTEKPVLRQQCPMAISASSKHKEQAWEFIKAQFSDEEISSHCNFEDYRGGFPITKSGAELFKAYDMTDYTDFSQFDETKDDPEWSDYKGMTYELSFAAYGDDVIKLGPLTDDDIKAVEELIANAVLAEEYLPLTQDFYNILNEEIDRFIHGGCTAEECADATQSRVSIYLSEQFG